MMRQTLLATLLMLLPAGMNAQEKNQADDLRITQIFGETRLGFHSANSEGHANDDKTGFRGDYLNFRIDGQIVSGLTFSYRQRLNKNSSASFFDATDWLHLDWKAAPSLTLSAGKQVVAIGGFEYDRAPIDLYYCSEFWQNIACYQLGVSAAYDLTQHDQLLLQVCNSPFRTDELCGNNTYAFNLMWYGHHGVWETMWSANVLNRTRSRYMTFVALGNRFNITPQMHLDVDVMNRMTGDCGPFHDFSVMTELSYQPTASLRCHLKYTHDENNSDDPSDLLVHAGTTINMFSGGVEYAPLKDHREALRIFALAGYAYGTNTNPGGTVLYDSSLGQTVKNQLLAEVGVKIKIMKE